MAYEEWVIQRCGRYAYQRVLMRFHPDLPVPSTPNMPPLRIAARYAAGKPRPTVSPRD
jgi:hypothetical protein